MADTKYKTTNVVLTDADFDKAVKGYVKKDVKLNYYDFDELILKMYDTPDKNMIGELHIAWVDKFTLRENDGEYGKYWSGTVEKGQLYFNVKKGLARRWESAPLTVTFREAILLKEIDTEGETATPATSDDDVPF